MLQRSLVEKEEVIPSEKCKKGAEIIVIHEVIHNIHKKVPQVWYMKIIVKFESLFWDL